MPIYHLKLPDKLALGITFDIFWSQTGQIWIFSLVTCKFVNFSAKTAINLQVKSVGIKNATLFLGKIAQNICWWAQISKNLTTSVMKVMCYVFLLLHFLVELET